MKNVFVLLLTALFASSTFTVATAGAGQKVPLIKFEAMQLNLGDVKEGEELSCSFKFTNVGKAPLLVESVEKVCGCTSVEWPKEAVAPGASGEIRMSYNTHARTGLFRRSITVKTNMGPDKDIYLLVKANVVPAEGQTMADGSKKDKEEKQAQGPNITFKEDNHNFGNLDAGTPAEFSFEFTNKGTEPLTINEAKISEDGYAVVEYPTEPVEPGASGVIKVTYNNTGDKEGKFRHSIFVKTNDFIHDTVELMVKGKIKKGGSASR